MYFYVIPMQLSFDMFYDDELEDFLHQYHFNPNLAGFLIVFPEMMLIIDTLLKCITGFYENGVIVADKYAIFNHYIKTGLIFDVISYVPILIQGIIKKIAPSFGLILKYFQLLMFFKIKRVKTAIMNYEEIIASNGKHDFFLSFCKMMYVIIFISHLNACTWHALAYFYPMQSCCTWLDFYGFRQERWVTRYISSFYWSISTVATIGYGEKISPQNNLESIFGSVVIIISIVLFGYCINSMKQILDTMSVQENEYK